MTSEIKPIKLDRSRIQIKENEYVVYNGEIFKVTQLIDFTEIIGINIQNKRATRLLIKDVKPISPDNINENISIYKDTSSFSDKDYKQMEEKYLAIEPLLSNNMSTKEIEQHAKNFGVHYTTIYTWLKNYKSTGTLLGLLSRSKGRKKGEVRIDYMSEKIIQETIDTYYLTKQKPSIQYIINKINIICKIKILKHLARIPLEIELIKYQSMRN